MVNFIKLNERLPVIMLIVGYFTVFFVNIKVANVMVKISYAMLTLLGIFLGFLIVKDVIQKYQEKYEIRRKEISLLINKSIDKERNEKTETKEKIEECDKRVNLYQKLDKLSPNEMSKAGFLALIFIIITLLLNAFLSSLDGIINIPIKSFHVSYIFFLVSLFFTIRLVLIFFSVTQDN